MDQFVAKRLVEHDFVYGSDFIICSIVVSNKFAHLTLYNKSVMFELLHYNNFANMENGICLCVYALLTALILHISM